MVFVADLVDNFDIDSGKTQVKLTHISLASFFGGHRQTE